MSSAASSLMAGLHLDRKRFANDIALFQAPRPRPSQQDLAPDAAASSAAAGGRDDGGKVTSAPAPGRKTNETERVALLRKEHRIHMSCTKAPAPLLSFAELTERYGCPAELVQQLEDQGLRCPTPIQRQAIPILMQGQECFACAPTGSGKTLAYGIPIMKTLQRPTKEGIRALVLSPTRELATQIARELKRVGQALAIKVRVLTKSAARCNDLMSAPGCDVMVATPLRLCSLLGDAPKIDLSKVQHLVLDEADKLFEMGFVEQIDKIVSACSNQGTVKSLFSATLPETVETLARTIMHDPIRITIGERNSATSSVKQELLFVGSEQGKMLAMRQLLKEGMSPPVLVFVHSKDRAQDLYRKLVVEEGVTGVGVIHADRTQNQRDRVVEDFRCNKVWILIATDLMGRGMDFKGVNLVINFDFPPSTASYIHRVGRTGRAGQTGRAITFHTEDDKEKLRGVAHVMHASGTDVPPWMLSLPKVRRGRRKVRGTGEEGEARKDGVAVVGQKRKIQRVGDSTMKSRIGEKGRKQRRNQASE